LSLGVLALAAARAEAGAWIAPEGGQAIQTEVVGARNEAAYLESQLYLEQPIGPRVSLVARPWLENGASVGEQGWRAEAEGGVKAALVRTAGAAIAVQASALWRSDPDPGCGEGGGEVRALGGVSLADGRGFVNAEAGARVPDGGSRRPPRSYRRLPRHAALAGHGRNVRIRARGARGGGEGAVLAGALWRKRSGRAGRRARTARWAGTGAGSGGRVLGQAAGLAGAIQADKSA
jgi:hypothetical protein